MKNVYKVTYDVKINGKWVGGEDYRHVLSNGDARDACQLLEKTELDKEYEAFNLMGQSKGKTARPTEVRIISVEHVVSDVLT